MLASKQENLAIEQISGCQRINIYGAVDLETGQTKIIEVVNGKAQSTIRLFESIEAYYPGKQQLQLLLDNTRYHHTKLVNEWLSRPSCRIVLHFIQPYCPHLNSIKRLWSVMRKHIKNNKYYNTCVQFAETALIFLKEKVPVLWENSRDSIIDNFRIIAPDDFWVLK